MTGAHGEFAPAKLNLHLHVTGRRPDGYHTLDSLAVFPPVGDRVTVAPADGITLRVGGPFAAALAGAAGGENIVLRAARALRARHGIAAGAAITLEKNLPVASGIGGGSADAAATLRALRRLWALGPDAIDPALALALGADVPVCVASRPVRMGGIGEILGDPPTLPAFSLALVNPGVAVPTPAVFAARAGGFRAPAVFPAGWADAAAMARDLAEAGNDLEAAAIGIEPRVGEVLALLAARPGALLARMSGSGATCFAVFAAPAAAAAASAAARARGWWSWSGDACCDAAVV